MQHRILATAIALLFGLSMPVLVAAKGHGGGHSGGAHAGSGHASGGHASGGHASSGGHSGGGHASAGQKGGFRGGGVKTGGGGTTSGGGSTAAPRGASPSVPVGTTQPRGSSHPPDDHIVGTAAPRPPHSRDVFVVTPSIYTPRFFHRSFPGLGFGFGIRHLGYGFGPAYYGLGYAPSLFCEATFDCDFVPMIGVVDVPYESAAPYPPYESVAPYAPASAAAFGSVRVDVQPPVAQIFVDGEYVGTVEDFKSGSGLPLDAGVHRVEFRAPGYEPLVVDMRIAAGRRITYRGVMKPQSP